MFEFAVVDKKTGKYPDIRTIAQTEEWAKGLAYRCMSGFSIDEDGTLSLGDKCGLYHDCPNGRFDVVLTE